MGFKLFVYGLWFSGIWLVLAFLGEAISPGSLNDGAFTDIGILATFSLFVLDTMFTLGSVE